MATDIIDGYRDRGFQVLPAGDPGVRRELDASVLKLGSFASGAIVMRHSRSYRLADPRRHPLAAIASCIGGLGSARATCSVALGQLGTALNLHAVGRSVHDDLAEFGLDGELTRGFVHPWLAGITLDRDLRADVGAVAGYVVAFTRAPAALPAGGMGAIRATFCRSTGWQCNNELWGSGCSSRWRYFAGWDARCCPAVVVAAAGLSAALVAQYPWRRAQAFRLST